MRYDYRFNDEERKGDGGRRPKNRIISSSRRGAQLKAELLGKILPWEKITVSLENFPHYIESVLLFPRSDLIFLRLIYAKRFEHLFAAKSLHPPSRNALLHI